MPVKITLKRALKLRKELEAMLAKIELPTAIQLSLLIEQNVKNPADAIKPGTEALVKRVDEILKLSHILATIRVNITKANAESGVEAALAESAHATRAMAIYKKLMGAGVVPPQEQLVAELNFSHQALQSPDRSGYGRPDRSVAVSVVLPDLKDNAGENYTYWKRFLEGKEDFRTGKNAAVQIEIADGDATLLRQQGLI
jgi:hypothetical protein